LIYFNTSSGLKVSEWTALALPKLNMGPERAVRISELPPPGMGESYGLIFFEKISQKSLENQN
jgi:hypothetical protein